MKNPNLFEFAFLSRVYKRFENVGINNRRRRITKDQIKRALNYRSVSDEEDLKTYYNKSVDKEAIEAFYKDYLHL